MKNILKINSGFCCRWALVILTLLFSNSYLIAQEPAFTIEIVTENSSNQNAKDGKILVQVNSNSGGYIFQLYDELPIAKAKTVDQSDRINSESYSFTELKKGIYYVCVYDIENNRVCEKVEIVNQ